MTRLIYQLSGRDGGLGSCLRGLDRDLQPGNIWQNVLSQLCTYYLLEIVLLIVTYPNHVLATIQGKDLKEST